MPSLLRHGAVKSEFLAVKEKIGNAEEIGMLFNEPEARMNFFPSEVHPKNLPQGAAIRASLAARPTRLPSLSGAVRRQARFRRGAVNNEFLQ